jgi:hypothetical protein
MELRSIHSPYTSGKVNQVHFRYSQSCTVNQVHFRYSQQGTLSGTVNQVHFQVQSTRYTSGTVNQVHFTLTLLWFFKSTVCDVLTYCTSCLLILKWTVKLLTYWRCVTSDLCALRTNHREIGDNPEQEVLELGKVIGSDAPWLIHQEHYVCLHPATHCNTHTRTWRHACTHRNERAGAHTHTHRSWWQWYWLLANIIIIRQNIAKGTSSVLRSSL